MHLTSSLSALLALAFALPAFAAPTFVHDLPAAAPLAFSLMERTGHPNFAWPQSLIGYPVRFHGRARPEQLMLRDVDAGRTATHQLSQVRTRPDGTLDFAIVHFLADLPSGGSRTFELSVVTAPVAAAPAAVRVTADVAAGAITFSSAELQVRLPASGPPPAGRSLPAPILALDRGTGWIGSNRLVSPRLAIREIVTEQTAIGPLFAEARVTYRFSNHAHYTATVRLTSGYQFVEFFEEMQGLAQSDGVALDFAWTGFKPTHRYMSPFGMKGGYRTGGDTQAFEKGIDEPFIVTDRAEDPKWHKAWIENPAEEMIYRLSPYSSNSVKEKYPVVSFWEAAAGGGNLAAIVLDHTRWQDHAYAVYGMADILECRFRHTDGVLHWSYPLVTGTRSTGIVFNDHAAGRDFIARSPFRHKATPFRATRSDDPSINFAQWVHGKFSVASLNVIKDWVLDYPRTARRAPDFWQTSGASALADPAEFERQLFTSQLVDNAFMVSDAGIGHRMTYNWIMDSYLRLQDRFTDEQRKRIDALLLFDAYFCAGEAMAPMRTAHAGTPNIVADGKSVPAELTLLFPDHSMSGEWLQQFQKQIELDGRFFARPDVMAYDSLGGRWTESPAAYTWAYLSPTSIGNFAALHHSGMNAFANPFMARIGNWIANLATPPIRNAGTRSRRGEAGPPPLPTEQLPFERQLIPHGAHSAMGASTPSDHVFFLGQWLRRYAPLTAEHLLWLSPRPGRGSRFGGGQGSASWTAPKLGTVSERENHGTNPHLRSAKFTGHGVVLRAGVDTPEELSVHLQQIDEGPNYRWGRQAEGSSGMLYFFAGGAPWTGHESEDTGDRTNHDTDNTTIFGVYKNGTYRSIGMNVLERPLFDLGLAQFGEIVPRKGQLPHSWPEYQGRSAMLVGTDYFVLADEVHAEGTETNSNFSWFVPADREFPFIHFLEPLNGDHWSLVQTRSTKGFYRQHTRSSVALVTHKPEVSIESLQRSGDTIAGPRVPQYLQPAAAAARVPTGVYRVRTPTSTDIVFRRYDPIAYQMEGDRFAGHAGVIRRRSDGAIELALFRGTEIATPELALYPQGRELGASARREPSGEVAGCTFSPHAGRLVVALRDGHRTAYVDGRAVDMTPSRSGEYVFDLPPGAHRWEISTRQPKPAAPPVVRTENGRDRARVFFGAVPGAQRYRLELSRDGGTTWARAAEGDRSPVVLEGLPPQTKVHVRIVAFNGDRESDPGDEYPIYVSSQPPAAPHGLTLELGSDRIRATWGEILGITHYRLYRRDAASGAAPDSDWRLIYEGLDRTFADAEARGAVPHFKEPGYADNALADLSHIACYEYAVAAVDEDGEGGKSSAVSSDPRHWNNWQPDTPDLRFRRRSIYMMPPYVDARLTPPEFYPD